MINVCDYQIERKVFTMQIKYNVTGDRRKAMVAVMRDVLQDTTRYLGAPSFAFQVGAYTVTRMVQSLALMTQTRRRSAC